MTGQDPPIPATIASDLPVCGACGKTVTQPIDGRCNFCGERLHDADVTSEDHTPYAIAIAEGRRGWRNMCRWVYTAGSQRLRHLGLSRMSRASRRFSRINLWLFAAVAALTVFANSGWRVVTPQPGVLAESLEPAGKGWWQIASSPEHADALWWNPAWALVVGAATLILAVIEGSLLLIVIGRRASRAARGSADEPPRLRCAMQYSTAWTHLLSLALFVMLFAPLVHLSAGLHWGKIPNAVFRVPAALLVIAGLLLWWLWCIRLGQTMPQANRRRVQRFFVLWMPLIVALVVGGTIYGSLYGAAHLAQALNLNW